MRMFRSITSVAFNRLSEAEQDKYLEDWIEHRIRENYPKTWEPKTGFCPLSSSGMSKSEWRRACSQSLDAYNRVKDQAIVAINRDLAAYGVPADAERKPLQVNVAKYGKRYVWSIEDWLGTYPFEIPFGEQPTEDEAYAAGEKAAIAIIDKYTGQLAEFTVFDEVRKYYLFDLAEGGAALATRRFQSLAKEERKKRPSKGGTGANETRFVVVVDHGSAHLHRIIKETAKQIHFEENPFSNMDGLDVHQNRIHVGDRKCVIRKAKVENGWVNCNGGSFYYARVFVSVEAYKTYLANHAWAAESDLTAANEMLAELKQRMIDAHPDKGGSHEAFIAARKEYEAARRRCKHAA
jgi:hypothetical protein